MGYYIRALPDKAKFPRWKVQFISHKKADTAESKAQKAKKEWDVSSERWRTLGFLPRMSLSEAKARAKQLNALKLIKAQERRLRLLRLEELQTGHRYRAFLPEEFKEEFEKRFIRKRDSQTEQGLRRFSRAHILWRAVQKLVIAVQVEPSEWFCHHHLFYDYFYEQGFSLSYINKILAIANVWGFFISRKIGEPFLPIPRPNGYERQRLVERYYESERARRRASAPLTSSALAQAKGKMKARQFNWLFISVWLGLRPQEMDNLKSRASWNVETLASGTRVLWAFQSKLVTLPPEDRWKAIPLIYDEQRFALRMIEARSHERPLVKTIQRYFGDGISLYGGRNGFADLMLECGHSIEAISQWMGHATIARTWRTYKNRRGFAFTLGERKRSA